MPGPPLSSEPSSPDIEMMDITDELEPPAGADSDLPPPDTTTLTNQLDGLDETQAEFVPELDELLTGGPCNLSADAIVINSDTDSDISDDDGYDRLSHQDQQDQQLSPPGSVDGRNSDNATPTQTASMFTNLFGMSLTLTGNVR